LWFFWFAQPPRLLIIRHGLNKIIALKQSSHSIRQAHLSRYCRILTQISPDCLFQWLRCSFSCYSLHSNSASQDGYSVFVERIHALSRSDALAEVALPMPVHLSLSAKRNLSQAPRPVWFHSFVTIDKKHVPSTSYDNVIRRVIRINPAKPQERINHTLHSQPAFDLVGWLPSSYVRSTSISQIRFFRFLSSPN
jgi:hypothetical protein